MITADTMRRFVNEQAHDDDTDAPDWYTRARAQQRRGQPTVATCREPSQPVYGPHRHDLEHDRAALPGDIDWATGRPL